MRRLSEETKQYADRSHDLCCVRLFVQGDRMTRTQLLRQPHIARLGRLLDMLYKPAEIANEIGVHVDTVYRSYLPAGLPHTRDRRGNIWIHGPAFRDWAHQVARRRRTRCHPLAPDQAWCVVCKTPVALI